MRDGEVVAAAQEERFSRQKGDASLPVRAARFCLDFAGLVPADLDAVVFYDKPIVKLDRLLSTYAATAPRSLRSFLVAMPAWLSRKLWVADELRRALGYDGEVLFGDHHESHAASAFYPSGFSRAAVLTLDGVGEWSAGSLWLGEGLDLTPLAEQRFPHSLGLLYSTFTYYCGFRVNSGEYKLMGLAPYGAPVFRDRILDELVDLKPDGSFRLDCRRFGFLSGLTMTNGEFEELFGGPPRSPEGPLGRREMDLAASIQAVTEEIVLRQARRAHELTGADSLCLAGGVALNCVANGRLLREGPFERIWVQPAAGDAGGALGAALAAYHRLFRRPRAPDGRRPSPYLGPGFSDDEVAAALQAAGARFVTLTEEELCARVAALLDAGKVVGWFQGRMEFGPRALGARSILADARSPGMQSELNLKIKFREGFRPFAPAVLEARAADWFEGARPSPYMLFTFPVRRERMRAVGPAEGFARLQQARSEIPAVTHVDGSARIQTVDREGNPRLHRLLSAFEARTGTPLVINTSFNVRGEPIVCTPEDAWRCFRRTAMDALAIGSHLLLQQDQPPWNEDETWRQGLAGD